MHHGALLIRRVGNKPDQPPVSLTRSPQPCTCIFTTITHSQLGRDGLLAELKNDKHRRSIDMPASTLATLKEHKRRQNEERLLIGPEWQDQGLVFCTHQGKPLGWRNVTREYKVLLTRAGLPDYPFHALRHTNATLLLLQGIHPKVVQERLGHANIGMTLDIYSHVLPRLGQEAAAKLDALLA